MTTALAAGKVGVAMPTQSLQRWNQDGANMKAQLEAAGYEVDLQYANNDVAAQVSQIENMLLGGAEVLVIASIDGGALDTVLGLSKQLRHCRWELVSGVWTGSIHPVLFRRKRKVFHLLNQRR